MGWLSKVRKTLGERPLPPLTPRKPPISKAISQFQSSAPRFLFCSPSEPLNSRSLLQLHVAKPTLKLSCSRPQGQNILAAALSLTQQHQPAHLLLCNPHLHLGLPLHRTLARFTGGLDCTPGWIPQTGSFLRSSSTLTFTSPSNWGVQRH